MASRVTHGESLEWDSSENDENESDFESSESEEESFDDDRVYGFPNDRDGSAFNVAAEEESSQNDETDSQGSGFSDEEENNIGDNVIQIAFVDEEDPEIRVARHNVIMQTAEAATAPELQAQQRRRIVRQRRANRRPDLNLQWQKGNVTNTIPMFNQRSGTVRVWGGNCTPLSFLQLFWSDDLYDFIRVQTNKNAEAKRNANPEKHKTQWREINELSEMKAFFGVCLAMGILKLPLVEMYWQKKFSLFEVNDWSSAMSRNRFNSIMRYLKFCDEQVDKPAVEPGQPGYDKLYKVRRFLSMLLPKYEREWISSQWLAIDEQIIPYRGRVGFRQFIANKPNRFGIKVWAMADAKTGYILKQQIYTGKNLTAVNNTEDAPYVGLAQQVVTDLVQGYGNKGYIVVTDNFYSSPSLSLKLKEMGIDSLGTVKASSKGFAKELVFPTKPKPQRGTSDWRNCGNLLAVSWFDNKAVYFLSTVHKPNYTRNVQEEDQVVRRRSKQGVVNIPSPPLLKDYNKYMCGIDRADQNNRYYSVGRQCKRWPPRVVFHQLETSINNAFQIYKAAVPGHKSAREFRMHLATELVRGYSASQHHPVGRKRANPDIEPRLQNVGVHLPLVGANLVCCLCSQVASVQHKRQCRNVPVEEQPTRKRPSRSNVYCSICEVHLCLNSTRNCWVEWHSKSSLC